MTARDFLQWLRTARSGAHLTYHTGNLQFDRRDNGAPAHRQINRLADAAWDAMKSGFVELKQRRVGDGVCAYVATRL